MDEKQGSAPCHRLMLCDAKRHTGKNKKKQQQQFTALISLREFRDLL